jgi:hypothetical protein
VKQTFLLLAALFCVILLYAQTDENNTPLPNKEFFKQAELVFEGVFLRDVYIYNLKGTLKDEDGYTIGIFKVLRVYKGDQSLTDSTIHVVRKGGLPGQEKMYDGGNLNVGYGLPYLLVENGVTSGVNDHTPAIYFFTTSDFPEDLNSKYTMYHKYKYVKKYIGFMGGTKYDKMHVVENKIIGLDSLVFHQREDFYNYMKKFKGFTVPEPISSPKKTTGKARR